MSAMIDLLTNQLSKLPLNLMRVTQDLFLLLYCLYGDRTFQMTKLSVNSQRNQLHLLPRTSK